MDDMMTAIEAEIPRLRRYAMCLVRDRHRADDLVQDCLVRAIDNRDSWQQGTNLRAWLFVILRNGFITELRKGKMREVIAEDPEEDHPSMTTKPNQLDRLHLQEVWNALNELSDEHREVLLLVVVEGFSYERTAEVLNLRVGTVRSRLSRARSTLKERLEWPSGESSVPPRPGRSQPRPVLLNGGLAGQAEGRARAPASAMAGPQTRRPRRLTTGRDEENGRVPRRA